MSEPALISLHAQRDAEVPFQTYKRSQAALARRRLYSLSAFYTLYAILVLAIAFSTKHPWIAVAFFRQAARRGLSSSTSSTAMCCTAVFLPARA